MVLARISCHLETTVWYHPLQIGFRQGLCTHNSSYHLRKTAQPPRSNQDVEPDLLVAVHLKKVFDTVTDESVMDAARAAGLTGRPLNFMKGFLEGRNFEVRMQGTATTRYSNAVGVPQGAIVFSRLFNISMARLVWQLEEVDELHFTIYTDDITLWMSCEEGITDQVAALKTVLDMTKAFLENTRMSSSPEILIHHH
ncbi:uncharacterized protein [Dermacentor andersoni]|uniref:uncharacterized protein n=1 Tax=Dermacentor andersoni TaxID=34620 RepID=UPI003B3B32BA